MLRRIFAIVALASLATMPAWAEIARVKTSVGSATVERGTSRLPASPGLQLNPGDRLVTGKDGRISVSFIDNTRFSVGPNSRIAVNEFNYDRTRQKGSFVTQVDRVAARGRNRVAKTGRSRDVDALPVGLRFA